jgi:hypothetical protein
MQIPLFHFISVLANIGHTESGANFFGVEEVIEVRFWNVTASAGARRRYSSSSLLHQISSGRETFSRLARLT